jgi:uncharacterized protein related to proFAR isomerase
MSRFIDKLNKLRQGEPHPMGFMTSVRASEKSKMQLIVSISADNLDSLAEAVKKADAVIVGITKADDSAALEKSCQLKDGTPSGGWYRNYNAATVKKILGTECDFVVFAAGAPLSVARKEKLGRVLELDLTMNEAMLRTTNDLPVDAVLVPGKDPEIALTISRLMQIHRAVYLGIKPVLAVVPDTAAGEDLQVLLDMGVSGVVVEVADEKSAAKLEEMAAAIEKLNPAAFRKKSRMSAILPQMQPEAPKPPEEEGGGEEDE